MIDPEDVPDSNLNVFSTVYGCSLPDSAANLQRLGWRVVGEVQLSKSLSVITARSPNQHALMYARDGKICTINFGRPGHFSFGMPSK